MNENIAVNGSTPLNDIEAMMLKKYCSLWVLKYKTIRGKPTTFISKKSPFKHRPWQVQMIDDNHPNKVVEKSRQVGSSENSLSEILHFAVMNERVNIVYTFPRSSQMEDFSRSRITPVFQDSPYMRTLLSKEVNNVSAKKFFNGSWLFMRSAWGDGSLGEGTSCDLYAADEYAKMPEGSDLPFLESLKSSKYGLIRRWSTPTLPGVGVSRLFDLSDQKRYVWTCEHCGEKQYLTFEDNVIQQKDVNLVQKEIADGSYIIGCKKCKKELNRWAVGEWVSFRDAKEISGYHITQMDATWISADDIMRRSFNYPSKQLFHNYVLGQPYTSMGMVITDSDVLDAIRLKAPVLSRTTAYTHIVAGIDWGMVNWLVILGLRDGKYVDLLDIQWVEDDPVTPLKSANYFTAILKAYSPDLIIADAGYGADRNSYMYTQFSHAFYSCQWVTPKNSESRLSFIDTWNENKHEVTVNKTVKVQRTLHQIKGRLISMFPLDEKLSMLIKHLKNTRIMDEEDKGVIYQIATRIGDDHTACALTYGLIGIDRITNMGLANTQGFTFEFM